MFYNQDFNGQYAKENVSNKNVKLLLFQPTYLMAPVKIVSSWMCYNMNALKFESLIHQFFGRTCLDIDVFDKSGKKHNPREWFIVPLQIIEQAVLLIISGDIVNFTYDSINKVIVER